MSPDIPLDADVEFKDGAIRGSGIAIGVSGRIVSVLVSPDLVVKVDRDDVISFTSFKPTIG